MSLFPIPIEDITVLKHMNRAAAAEWLSQAHPNLAPQDVDALLKLAAPDLPPIQEAAPTQRAPKERAYVVDPRRNRFILAANYACVSQYQLAQLYGVSRQTIYSIIRVHKERDDNLRRESRRWNTLQMRAMQDWFFSTPGVADLPLPELIQRLIAIGDASTSDPLE